jgi:hypothetical protein
LRTCKPRAVARELCREVVEAAGAAEGVLRRIAAAASRPRLDAEEEEEDEELELLEDERGAPPRLSFFEPASCFAPTAVAAAGWEGAAATGTDSLESGAPVTGAASAGAAAVWE